MTIHRHRTIMIALALFLLTAVATTPAKEPAEPSVRAASSCIDCHRDTTPGITVTWELSAHGATNVLCIDCHGTDEQAAHSSQHTVDALRCGACHSGALFDHRLSRHSREPDASDVSMARTDCSACHSIAGSCQSCHSNHSTDPDISSRAEACGSCHNAETPLTRIWASSAHGALYAARGEPSCTSCHMEGGSHNISRGMASRRPADQRVEERGAMVGVCTSCHAPALALRSLEDADRLKSQARALMERARLTLDTQKNSPPHAFEATDRESRHLATMATAYRAVRMGAYHQNRAAALKALSDMQRSLARIKARAETMERIGALERRLDNLAARQAQDADTDTTEALKRDLRALKDSLIKDELSEVDYQRGKDELLDGAGL